MVPELNYSARIALEHEDHSTADLGGGHCHIGIPELRSLTEDRRRLLPLGRRF
jgi:hypothetical protein